MFDIFGKNDYYDSVKNNITGIDYYLDFIDASSTAIGEISIRNIGRRTYVINDNSINCIFEPEIPRYYIIEAGKENTAEEREVCEQRLEPYIQVPSSIYKNLAIGGKYNSAFEQTRQLLYNYTRYMSSVSLTTIPIYHLEPNSLIFINDRECGIYGNYNIDSITIPLDVNSTMSISCSKALEGF